MNFPSLIESGQQTIDKIWSRAHIPDFAADAKTVIKKLFASFATNVHNAAIESALEALPPINRIESYADEMTDTEKGWDNYEEQARAKLSALKKENV